MNGRCSIAIYCNVWLGRHTVCMKSFSHSQWIRFSSESECRHLVIRIGRSDARMHPTIHKISSHVIIHHPLKHAIFFWPSSYINRRSFSIPRNSWLSRFFLDLGGAENRCEILGRRMSGSSVGWFSDILDIFFWSFSENIYKNHGKPWEKQWKKTMETTMENHGNNHGK